VTYCEGVTRRLGIPGRRSTREPVYQITGARRGVRDDVNARTRRYLVSMGVRTVCFVLAVVTGGWLRWVFIVLALVLPYLAVVFANGGRERVEEMPDESFTADRRAIDGSQG
jgi:Flp pilus assembly protein TadB